MKKKDCFVDLEKQKVWLTFYVLRFSGKNSNLKNEIKNDF